MADSQDNTTHFGYKTVETGDKAGLVRGVFDSVATRYDIMNDLMSAGLHRLWKRYTIDQAAAKPGNVILDLAGGGRNRQPVGRGLGAGSSRHWHHGAGLWHGCAFGEDG